MLGGTSCLTDYKPWPYTVGSVIVHCCPIRGPCACIFLSSFIMADGYLLSIIQSFLCHALVCLPWMAPLREYAYQDNYRISLTTYTRWPYFDLEWFKEIQSRIFIRVGNCVAAAAPVKWSCLIWAKSAGSKPSYKSHFLPQDVAFSRWCQAVPCGETDSRALRRANIYGFVGCTYVLMTLWRQGVPFTDMD